MCSTHSSELDFGETVPKSWVFTWGYSFSRIGAGLSHHLIGAALVDVSLVDGSIGSAIAVLAECEPLEFLSLGQGVGGVEVAEQVVERAVLAHDDDEVIEKPGVSRGERSVKLSRAGLEAGVIADGGGSGSDTPAGDHGARGSAAPFHEAASRWIRGACVFVHR